MSSPTWTLSRRGARARPSVAVTERPYFFVIEAAMAASIASLIAPRARRPPGSLRSRRRRGDVCLQHHHRIGGCASRRIRGPGHRSAETAPSTMLIAKSWRANFWAAFAWSHLTRSPGSDQTLVSSRARTRCSGCGRPRRAPWRGRAASSRHQPGNLRARSASIFFFSSSIACSAFARMSRPWPRLLGLLLEELLRRLAASSMILVASAWARLRSRALLLHGLQLGLHLVGIAQPIGDLPVALVERRQTGLKANFHRITATTQKFTTCAKKNGKLRPKSCVIFVMPLAAAPLLAASPRGRGLARMIRWESMAGALEVSAPATCAGAGNRGDYLMKSA